MSTAYTMLTGAYYEAVPMQLTSLAIFQGQPRLTLLEGEVAMLQLVRRCLKMRWPCCSYICRGTSGGHRRGE